MGRGLWLLALVLTFVLGLAAGGGVRQTLPPAPEVDRLRETVNRLQQQIGALQARLRAREGVPHVGTTAYSDGASGPRSTDRFAGATFAEDAVVPGRPPREGSTAQLSSRSQIDGAGAGARGPAEPAPTVEAALDRFYRYLEVSNEPEGRERSNQMRELLNELRAMGDAGAQALMHVLASGTDSDERRAAARLLGTLQVPEALPLLREVIERDEDLLLRRAAAAGLRQLRTPESLPVMERIVTNPTEDRFVRLSAASGLAASGRSTGVNGLVHIFEESTGDGRGRDAAFRALASLKDERSLPFMRQVVSSGVEPSYRLQAIRYVEARGDRQSLGSLQIVMQSPTEQPSVRDAATRAYTALGGK
jgi:HEAT repeat protein